MLFFKHMVRKRFLLHNPRFSASDYPVRFINEKMRILRKKYYAEGPPPPPLKSDSRIETTQCLSRINDSQNLNLSKKSKASDSLFFFSLLWAMEG